MTFPNMPVHNRGLVNKNDVFAKWGSTWVIFIKPVLRPSFLLIVSSCNDNKFEANGPKSFQCIESILNRVYIKYRFGEEIFDLRSGFIDRPPVRVLQ